MAAQVRTERDGRVVIATLENPPHGLMTTTMVRELDELVRRTDEDPGIGAVVLTGAHPERFIAHFDVAELLAGAKQAPQLPRAAAAVGVRAVGIISHLAAGRRLARNTPAAGITQVQDFHEMLLAIGRSGCVFIAAINGHALGGGCELSLACDLRVLARGALIGQPEILLGFPPGAGGTQRLARLIGRARALELLLEGRPVESEEAEEIGLVTEAVDSAVVLEVAMRRARRLATRSKRAVAAVKRATLEGGSLALHAGLRLEQTEFLSCLPTDEAIRAMEAYLAHLERTGELPAADPDAREALLEGTFIDLHG